MNTEQTPYPALLINNEALLANIKQVKDLCQKKGISITGIIKGFNGDLEEVKQYELAGCAQIGSSRIAHIIDAKKAGIAGEFMLIRIPMLSEVDLLVEWADMSLNSEPTVITKIQETCVAQNKRHGVVLMADLGDLREGFWNPEELIQEAIRIETELSNVDLLGIGTNLGCYGSIKPTKEKMEELCAIAKEIEDKIGHKLEIVSGGASTSYPLVLSGDMPSGINHLRIGESITIAYDLKEIWQLDDGDLRRDVFTLQAEVIEVKDKPTHPVGEVFVDCFGAKPTYEDRGIRKRAVLAVGRLDHGGDDKLIPLEEGVVMVGSSSDHTIVDIEDCNRQWKVGDVMEFALTYAAVMYLTNSKYVHKLYI
ncbi:alanine/ornithine racemase family PLP-dependent enzyme [Chakrabartyella piscis]|uniref:alanine/ornithine racemase family PLP-dependent enzyme n=1 Tax=Chakrabartyella piscis TaxID=2918914 RepID=UPI00295851FF|nr:alanine/ornithine racemase family PLP-dependent enzyme [Chakrabartyella piscis]